MSKRTSAEQWGGKKDEKNRFATEPMSEILLAQRMNEVMTEAHKRYLTQAEKRRQLKALEIITNSLKRVADNLHFFLHPSPALEGSELHAAISTNLDGNDLELIRETLSKIYEITDQGDLTLEQLSELVSWIKSNERVTQLTTGEGYFSTDSDIQHYISLLLTCSQDTAKGLMSEGGALRIALKEINESDNQGLSPETRKQKKVLTIVKILNRYALTTTLTALAVACSPSSTTLPEQEGVVTTPSATAQAQITEEPEVHGADITPTPSITPTVAPTPTPEIVAPLTLQYYLDGPPNIELGGELSEEQIQLVDVQWNLWKPYIKKLIEGGFVSGLVTKEVETGLQIMIVPDQESIIMYGKIVGGPNNDSIILPSETTISPQGLKLREMPDNWSHSDISIFSPEESGVIYWDQKYQSFVKSTQMGRVTDILNPENNEWEKAPQLPFLDEERMVWNSAVSGDPDAEAVANIFSIEVTHNLCERAKNASCGWINNPNRQEQEITGFERYAQAVQIALSELGGTIRPTLVFNEQGEVIRKIGLAGLNDPETRPPLESYDPNVPVRFIFTNGDIWKGPIPAHGFSRGWGIDPNTRGLVIVTAGESVQDPIWLFGGGITRLFEMGKERGQRTEDINDPHFIALIEASFGMSIEDWNRLRYSELHDVIPLLPVTPSY